MTKFIFIANLVNRSGGNLLNRLFDGNSKIATYPTEISFKIDHNIFKGVDYITGSPTHIPKFQNNIDPIKYFELEKDYDNFKYAKNEFIRIGVRKNYLEKSYYEEVIKTNFDFEKYFKNIKDFCSNSRSNEELYYNKHKAYFSSWDDGIHWHDPSCIVTHDSNGLFLNNFDQFFEDFEKSKVVISTRNCLGYVASEKLRIAKRFFGTRRFSKPSPPNFMIKMFQEYDLDALVKTWRVALDRTKILQEKYGDKIIIVRLETLAKNTRKVIDALFSSLELNVEPINYKPTICGNEWLGNSHMGPIKGIKQNPNDHLTKILSQEEIDFVKYQTKDTDEMLNKCNETTVNLAEKSDHLFFDVAKQRSHSKDKNRWALYCSMYFRGFRKLKLKTFSKLLNILVILFSIYANFYNYIKIKIKKINPDLSNPNNT